MTNSIYINVDNCWEKIGIFGDNTCEILPNVEHCYYCDVFKKAGRDIFNKAIPQNFIEEWTEIYSKAKDKEDTEKIALVIFKISDEWFSIEAKLFIEALTNRKIHPIPERTNKYFYGILNFNGELLLCIAINNILGIEFLDKDYNFGRYLLINLDDSRYCFPVDEFLPVKSISIKELKEVPFNTKKYTNSVTTHIFSINNTKVSFINADKLKSEFERILVW
jgi:chemotaxis-related protein WspD